MEGVTILSATTVTLGIPWGAAILIALVVFAFMFLLLSILAVDEPIEFLFAGIVALFATVIALIPLWISIGTTEVTEYKVIIDDSIKYVEFMEKYEVIDQEGEIYTVRERTKE
jgi:hypothetical protein